MPIKGLYSLYCVVRTLNQACHGGSLSLNISNRNSTLKANEKKKIKEKRGDYTFLSTNTFIARLIDNAISTTFLDADARGSGPQASGLMHHVGTQKYQRREHRNRSFQRRRSPKVYFLCLLGGLARKFSIHMTLILTGLVRLLVQSPI